MSGKPIAGPAHASAHASAPACAPACASASPPTPDPGAVRLPAADDDFPTIPPRGASPRLLAVCVGAAAPLEVGTAADPRTAITGIVKRAVSLPNAPLPVEVGPLGLAGDEQVDLTVHGGLDQAVYLYPVEHYAFWRTVRAQAGLVGPLPPGFLGENLLVSGLPESELWVGDLLHIGEVQLRVTRPRSPCYKFNARMGFAQASKLMIDSGFTGYYASVVRPGKLTAGSEVLRLPSSRVISISESHATRHRSGRRP